MYRCESLHDLSNSRLSKICIPSYLHNLEYGKIAFLSLYLIVKLRNPRPLAYSDSSQKKPVMRTWVYVRSPMALETFFNLFRVTCLLPKLKTSRSVSGITEAVNTLVMQYFLQSYILWKLIHIYVHGMKPSKQKTHPWRCALIITNSYILYMVETQGLEPWTPCLQSRCSSQLSYVPLLKANPEGFSLRAMCRNKFVTGLSFPHCRLECL
jgi:hypothetical protein